MSKIENIPCLDANNLDNIFFYLNNHLERNELAELTPEEEKLLLNTTEKVSFLFKQRNVLFDEEYFTILIKKLYPNTILLGGNGEIINYSNIPRQNMVFTFYDFTAILAFIVSIYLLYLSFLQFNQLTCNITGNNIIELSGEIREQLNIAIQSLSGQEFSY